MATDPELGFSASEVEAALRDLPHEYEDLLPLIRQVVFDNLCIGRVGRFLKKGNGRTIASYVRQVAEVIRTEFERSECLLNCDSEAWSKVCGALRADAYRQLIRLGVSHLEAFDRANDFAQEACVTLLQAVYPMDVPYMAWAKRILQNQIHQVLHRNPAFLDREALIQGSPSAEAEEEGGPDMPSEENFASRVEDRDTVEWAVAQLPSDAQREVLRRDLDGWSDEEIAGQICRSRQAVYNLRHRAHREVRRLLTHERGRAEEIVSD